MALRADRLDTQASSRSSRSHGSAARRPDRARLLDRVPDDERAELSALIDRFLVASADPRRPTDETLAYVREIAALAAPPGPAMVTEPPLLEARNRIGKKRGWVCRGTSASSPSD